MVYYWLFFLVVTVHTKLDPVIRPLFLVLSRHEEARDDIIELRVKHVEGEADLSLEVLEYLLVFLLLMLALLGRGQR